MNRVWIKLTAPNGMPSYVNMSLAHSMSITLEGKYKGMTNIDFSTTQSYCSVVVKETPERILTMMKGE